MLTFKVKRQNGSSLEMKLPEGTPWPEVLNELVSFLRGAGYLIPYEFELNLDLSEKGQLDEEE